MVFFKKNKELQKNNDFKYCKIWIKSLSSYLRSNQIKFYGELFKKNDFASWNTISHKDTSKSNKVYKFDILSFYDDIVFSAHEEKFKAVGFKMFYYHAKFERGEKLWQHIANDKQLYIIHLVRKNLLDVYCSKMKAIQVNQWTKTKLKSSLSKQIEINYEDCLKFFKETESQISKRLDLLKSSNIIEVEYDDLANDPEKTLNKLSTFLELKLDYSEPVFKKQESRNISETILNYSELKEKFQNTKWIKYFIH